jgi:flagellar assembly factor FliW
MSDKSDNIYGGIKMIIKTRYFGELDIRDEDIIRFGHGIPGFENVKRFVLIDSDEEGLPFKWIQGVDEPKPAFVIVDPFVIRRDYEINLNDEVLDELEIKSQSDVLVFCIVVVPEDISKMTVNLQAPLVINTVNRKGRQLILDTDRYSVRHYILEEVQGREDKDDAGTDKEKGSVHSHK